MSARFAIIDSLLYWLHELASLIAEYSSLDQNERLMLLLPDESGQKILGECWGPLSIHWTSEHGYKQIFLRCGGIQSCEFRMNDFARMSCMEHWPHVGPYVYRFDLLAYGRLDRFFIARHGPGCHSDIALEKFIRVFKRMLAEIE